jgi:glycosyltransferase involved in cell wall biosynthesis
MLKHITPLILTYNEEANLERTLAALSWAETIIVIDSYSTDRTLEILARHSNTKVFQRHFDSHAKQWNYGLDQVETEWVLSLDADYQMTSTLIEEISHLNNNPEIDSYWINFKFHVFGKPLNRSILPPREALFRLDKARYIDDGHTQLLQSTGTSATLQSFICHDDRKPLGRWLSAQNRYATLEVEKLTKTPKKELCRNDRIRQIKFVAPFAVLVYCLIFKRGLLDGRRGCFYAFQRMVAEMILSIRLLEAEMQPTISLKPLD